jgi:hypothetical protein
MAGLETSPCPTPNTIPAFERPNLYLIENRPDPALEVEKQLVMTELFDGFSEYLLWTGLFVAEGRGAPGHHSENSKPFLYKAIENRNKVLEHIGDFRELFEGSDSKTLYDSLTALMYDARCSIMGVSELSPKFEAENHNQLAGLLAEHKVLNALIEHDPYEALYTYEDPHEDQNELSPQAFEAIHFDGATYSSAEEDFEQKVDIIIPTEGFNMGLQVKGKLVEERKLRLGQLAGTGIIRVKVPMHLNCDQFKLSSPQRTRLKRRVINRYNRMIILAAAV